MNAQEITLGAVSNALASLSLDKATIDEAVSVLRKKIVESAVDVSDPEFCKIGAETFSGPEIVLSVVVTASVNLVAKDTHGEPLLICMHYLPHPPALIAQEVIQ